MSYNGYAEYLFNLSNLLVDHSRQPINQETLQLANVYLDGLNAVYPILIDILHNYGSKIDGPKPISPKSNSIKPISPQHISPKTNIFDNTKVNYVKYYKSSFYPYVGLRLVQKSRMDKYINYVVTDITSSKGLKNKTLNVSKVDMYGNTLDNITHTVALVKIFDIIDKPIGNKWAILYRDPKDKFHDEDVVIPGIATNDGVLIFSSKEMGYTITPKIDPTTMSIIPSIGLLALISHSPRGVLKYVVSNLHPLTLDYIGLKLQFHTISLSYHDRISTVDSVSNPLYQNIVGVNITLGKTVIDEVLQDIDIHTSMHT